MKTTLLAITAALVALPVFGGEISAPGAPPGPMAQGGMLMPMISIRDVDDWDNPTYGSLYVMLAPTIPVMKSLEEWNSGAWFPTTAAWRETLGSPTGVGGTPLANAGSGALFSSRYGFMFDSDYALLPEGKSFAIRLVESSSPLMEMYNLVGDSNIWDRIWANPGDQVAWSGDMWHNLFVLPADAPAGNYTVTFEIYLIDYAFQTGTGAADYSLGAMNAARDPNFDSTTLIYEFQVIPEPSTWMLLGAAGVLFIGMRQWQRRRA